MAPRGKAGAPASRGGSRRGASTASSSRGGGIQKRRAHDRQRIDKDGDLVMDAASQDGRKRRGNSGEISRTVSRARQSAILSSLNGRGTSLHSRISQAGSALRSNRATNPDNTTTLKIIGLKESRAAGNDGGGLRDLIGFLERKAQSTAKLTRPVRIKKSRMDGPSVFILVSKQDSEAIMMLNNFMFAGATLAIEAAPNVFQTGGNKESLSQIAKETKDKLMAILQKRYNPEGKFLDLSGLGDDVGLREIGAFEPGVMPEKLFKALMKICNDTFSTPEAKREAVVCISLARNSLDDVQQVYTLADTLPDLKQLDLSNNRIASVKCLSRWRHKFRQLEGLLILDNPICNNESGFGLELVKWYPRLQNLNHAQARTPEEAEAAAAEAVKRRQPQPLPHAEAIYSDASGVAEPFIRDFLPTYDSNRSELAAKYYDADSTFTLNVDTHAMKSMKNAPILPWSAYIKLSRNTLKITTRAGRLQRTFKGTNVISELWSQLPRTNHPDLTTSFNKYVIECQQQDHIPDPTGTSPAGVVGLHIVIIGEFEEFDAVTNTTGKRSFTRSITLGPGRPGGNQIRVLNDMLSLRAFRGVPPISEAHQNIQKINELSEATRLTLGYAEMCLGDVGYDYQAALRLFGEKKHELPPDAFILDGT